MSVAALPRPRPRSPLRSVVRLLLAVVVALALGLAALVLLAVDFRPPAAAVAPPDAAAASRTRDVAESLQALIATRGGDGAWTVSESQINAVLASAQRLKPGASGRTRVTPDRLFVDLVAGPPLTPAGTWLNLRLGLAASEAGLEIASARLGRLPLPPALAMAGVRFAADRVLGPDLGPQALDAVAALRLAPPAVTVVLERDPQARAAFFEALRERALAGAGTTAREQVYTQLWHLDKSVRQGGLPRQGTMLPYLGRAITVAARLPAEADREAMRAALYALALYCGEPEFGSQIGVGLREELRGAANGCDGTTLAGRDDLKRHFVVSAGLEAASEGGAAFGMGELKELLDSNEGGSGFSFADMAADVAGVRFAQTMLAAPREAWRGMIDAVAGEADLMPSLDGLPPPMSEAEFRAAYGDVDSPAYLAMVAEIEARVDALPFHGGG